MTYDASNRKQVRAAEKEFAKREALRLEFLRRSMSTIEGRAWFHNLLSHCRLFSDPFTGDPLREAYSKGERNVGLGIYNDIVSFCPEQFVLMMQEETARDRAAAIEQSRGQNGDGGDQGRVDSYDDDGDSAS